ncbi:MAG: DNA polymerase ligase N-terminal domain-containing protein [Pirellulaceae bacterium]
MTRFVILRHEPGPYSSRPLHWDLMLETGGVLRTWALAAEPGAACVVEGEQLADHRLAYLEFEGELLGGRGNVSRWDRGTYRLLDETPDLLQCELHSPRLPGNLRLIRQPAGQRWNVVFGPKSNDC